MPVKELVVVVLVVVGETFKNGLNWVPVLFNNWDKVTNQL